MEQTLVHQPIPLEEESEVSHSFLQEQGGHLTRAWWGVVALFLVHGLVVSTWVSRIAGVKAKLALSDGSFGLALFGAAVGAVTAIPVSGWGIRRFGSRRAVQWSATGLCVSLVLLAYANSLPFLFAALFFYGSMTGANDVAINAQAVGVEKRMGRPTMSRFHAMFSLGGILGAAIGGLVASAGLAPFGHFIAAGSLILLFLVLATPLIIDIREPSEASGAWTFAKPPAALVALSIIGFCIFLSEGAVADWTAVYIKEVLRGGEGIAAAGYAAFSAAMTIFRFTGDAITARLGRSWTIRAGGIVAAFGLGVVALAHSPFVALTGFAIAGAGFSSIIPVVFAAGGRVSSVSEATGVATVSGIGYLGFLAGPPMMGWISETTSLRVSMCFLVVLSAIAALMVSAVERQSGRGSNPLA